MKQQLTLSKLIPRPVRFGSALAGLLLLVIAASSSSGQVLPPSSLPYGLSYQEWSAKWWQWNLGQDTNYVELVGEPGICTGPASRVLFLAGAPGSITVTNHVIIPAKTPLFFTILSAEADNTGCPMTSLTADELAAEATGAWSAVTATTCTIDGVAVAGLDNPTNTIYNVVSPPFSYTTAEHGNFLPVFNGVTCIPGGTTIYPAVADGVYLMLSPLSPGKHKIHFVGEVGPGGIYVTEDITYDITVLPNW
ncbi:MAG: hypothetical protein ABSF10_09775 [Verrucomicrobiota bacterium]|jgi:hypothetical protein